MLTVDDNICDEQDEVPTLSDKHMWKGQCGAGSDGRLWKEAIQDRLLVWKPHGDILNLSRQGKDY